MLLGSNGSDSRFVDSRFADSRLQKTRHHVPKEAKDAKELLSELMDHLLVLPAD